MFNVIERLRHAKLHNPEKYERLCQRLHDFQHAASSSQTDFDHHAIQTEEQIIAVRKTTDDFFSRLITVDRNNDEYWRNIATRWVGKTTIEDLPHLNPAHIHHFKNRRKAGPQLVATIALANDPKELFRLCLENNHPQRIMQKLLLNRDRKYVLYGLRTKFGLPLPPHLSVKQHFQLIDTSHSSHVHEQPRSPLLSPELQIKDSEGGHEHHDGTFAVHTFADSTTQLTELITTSAAHHKPDETKKEEKEEGAKDEGSRTPDLDAAAGNVEERKQSDYVLDIPLTAEKTPSMPLSNLDLNKVTFIGNDQNADVADKETDSTEKPPVDAGESVVLDDDGKPIAQPSQDSTISEGGGGGMDQYRLQRLKIIFEESDLDDEPGLDIDEFKGAMRKIMGENVPEREIELIFMKVDANCDGNVDWAEFLEYTLREFQERDFMTQLTKDALFEKTPRIIPHSRNPREIRSLVYAPSNPHGKTTEELMSGRYFTMNEEGVVQCWSTDFKLLSSFPLIENVRSDNAFIRANHMCAMPEIKTLVVSFTTGLVSFYKYDDIKMELIFTITGMRSPVLCLGFTFHDAESILVMGDQSGRASLLRFKNLQYEGLWGSLGLPHSNDPKISFDYLVHKGRAAEIKGHFGSDWIEHIRFYKNLNAVITCSCDPKYSMCVVPFHAQRAPLYYSDVDGFNCFDYNEQLNVIATGSKNRSIFIWNIDSSAAPTMLLEGHEAAIDQIYLLKDHDACLVISIDADQTVKVWDYKDQACLQTFDVRHQATAHYATKVLLYNPHYRCLLWGSRELLYLKRITSRKSDLVKTHETTHDKPIVGALYNDLFECVVTACQESTIMVWNFQTGEKIIQYRNAHTVNENGKVITVPIRSMTFDANKRRLLTCASDGLIKIWNFNNGACLSFYDYLEGTYLNAVRYQKNRDLVIATGWNRGVFMVRDTRGEDDVEERVYDFEKLHRSEITALEIVYQDNEATDENKSLGDTDEDKSATSASLTTAKSVAESDTESIQKSSISLGSARRSRSSRDDVRDDTQSKNSEGLASKSQQSNTESVEDNTDDIDDDEDDDEDDEDEELVKISDDGSILVTTSADGEIILWHCFSGEAIAFLNVDGHTASMTRMTRDSYVSPHVNDDFQLQITESGSIEELLALQTPKTSMRRPEHKAHHAPHPPLEPIPVPPLPTQTKNCITALIVLSNRKMDDPSTATIITASTDGFIRGWSTDTVYGGLKGLFYGAHELDSFVTTMCTDEVNEILYTGDSLGYVKMWLLCEWLQSDTALMSHRHCFDPRSFPFMRHAKTYAPIIAFRSNCLMQHTVGLLPPAQRGFYQQPYALNSFRGHLKPIVQINVVFHRKVILTGSEDCSVRLWQFSGLYIGTLSQSSKFRDDYMKREFTCPVNEDESVVSEIEESVTTILDEEDDPDEIKFHPKVIIPDELEETASSVTFRVLHGESYRPLEFRAETVHELQPHHVHHEAPTNTEGIDDMFPEMDMQVQQSKTPIFEHFLPQSKPHEDQANFLVFNNSPLHQFELVGRFEQVMPKKLIDHHNATTDDASSPEGCRATSKLHVTFQQEKRPRRIREPCIRPIKALKTFAAPGIVSKKDNPCSLTDGQSCSKGPDSTECDRTEGAAIHDDIHIDLACLTEKEKEFAHQLVKKQGRHALFELLGLLDSGNPRQSLLELYDSLYSENDTLKPLIQPVMPEPPEGARNYLLPAKSITSMQRIDRVYRAGGSCTPGRAGHGKILPTQPTKLPSVVKGMLKDGQRDDLLLENLSADHLYDEIKLGGRENWGDQDSWDVIDKSVPMGKNATKRQRPVVGQNPCSNRYLYRQLSDSVLKEHPVSGSDSLGSQGPDIQSYLSKKMKK